MKAIQILVEDHIAIDGKQLRRSHDKAKGKTSLHMVSAWGSKNGIVLGQEKVRDKSNEIIAIPPLLVLLEIANCVRRFTKNNHPFQRGAGGWPQTIFLPQLLYQSVAQVISLLFVSALRPSHKLCLPF